MRELTETELHQVSGAMTTTQAISTAWKMPEFENAKAGTWQARRENFEDYWEGPTRGHGMEVKTGVGDYPTFTPYINMARGTTHP